MEMTTVWCVVCLLGVHLLVAAALKEHNGTYQTRFDNLDLDVILSSRRLVRNYVACLMGTKPCTAEGDELKRILPDALKTRCSKCSQKQKEGAKKVISTLQSKYPDQWQTLKKKWDLDILDSALLHTE